MARASIQTDLKNITDGASSTVSASLDGTPFTTSTIISSRVFTKASNTNYSTEPYVDFSGTSNPSDYTFTRTHDASAGTTTFTVKYRHPLKPPKTDVIRFFGEAKTSIAASSNKIHSYKTDESLLSSTGGPRNLVIYGDPHVALTLDVLKTPKRYSGSFGENVSLIDGESTVVIGPDGKYKTKINYPPTALLTDYQIKLTEYTSGSFGINLNSPTTVTVTQYPECEVRLTLSDSALGTTLPSTTTYKYFGEFNTTKYVKFTYVVTKSADLAVKYAKGFTALDLKKVDRTSASISDTTEIASNVFEGEYRETRVDYKDLKITIDNDLSPNQAIIEGLLKIDFGYNSGGHTLITLNVNDILKNA